MTQYNRGDIVTLSRVQASEIIVVTTPALDGEAYTVTLPLNGAPKVFALTDTLITDTVEDIASKLVAFLLNEQTHFSVAIDPIMPWRVALVGPLGEDFEIGVTPNLQTAIVQTAVLGSPPGRLRVIDSEGTVEKMRKFSTRDRDGNVLDIQLLLVRELDSSRVIEIRASDIQTVLETGT